IPFLVEAGFITEEEAETKYEFIKGMVSVLKEKLQYVKEITEHANIFFGDTVELETEECREFLNLEHIPTLIDALEAKVEAAEVVDEAFVKAAQAYEWKEATTAPTDAVVLVSDSEGRLEITGLEYGDYKLEEKQAPKGFAKLNGTVDFKVEKGSYDSKQAEGELDYKQEGTQVFGKQIKNKLVSIPQTGGIGSIIFVVAGLMIMGLAAYKMKANKEQA
ncbi:MAG: SpaA isopeptide-forming pilin-related protein, partial [Anaerococcus vaginalis]|uniref:SpaA isopeptide-forming pilin-related protein n=1 Tax=Anaerococcus vaginalis TaxID=33037 RepID=UPI002911771D|nr:SpaA isopeptide-forming pilin-related protein [Anaerococcus vaginalis]